MVEFQHGLQFNSGEKVAEAHEPRTVVLPSSSNQDLE